MASTPPSMTGSTRVAVRLGGHPGAVVAHHFSDLLRRDSSGRHGRDVTPPPGLVQAPTFEKDGAMPKQGKYPEELRERAVRLVLDHGHEYGSQ